MLSFSPRCLHGRKASPHLQPTEEVLGLNIQAPSKGPGIPGLVWHWQWEPFSLWGSRENTPPFVSYVLASFSKQVSGESQPVPQAVGWSVCNSEFV